MPRLNTAYDCLSAHMFQTSRNFRYMFYVAVDRSSSNDNAIMLCTSGFVDDVMFSHNRPNTDTALKSATQRIIHFDSPDGAAILQLRRRSLLSSIALVKCV